MEGQHPERPTTLRLICEKESPVAMRRNASGNALRARCVQKPPEPRQSPATPTPDTSLSFESFSFMPPFEPYKDPYSQPNEEKKEGARHKQEFTAEMAQTPVGLSWRRLHMCRAKLKETASTSHILCAFAMSSLVELQVNVPTKCPWYLFTMFSINTAALVSIHIFALFMSTQILPGVEIVEKLDNLENVDESPHDSLRFYIDLAFGFSTVLGLFLFLLQVVLLNWVKFWDYSFSACWAGTLAMSPFLVMFVVFCVHFYKRLVTQKSLAREMSVECLEEMKNRLDSETYGPGIRISNVD